MALRRMNLRDFVIVHELELDLDSGFTVLTGETGAGKSILMQGYPPNDAPQRIEKDRLALSLSRLRNVYSDNLIEVTEWCMSLDPLSRPQSVFALQKELSRETERRYTKLSFSERLKLQLENLTTGAKA